jgi:hypothetical protein
VDDWLHAADIEAQHTLQNLPHMTAQQATTCLIARPTRAQMSEAATQQKDKNETAHKGSGMTDTVPACEGAANLNEIVLVVHEAAPTSFFS